MSRRLTCAAVVATFACAAGCSSGSSPLPDNQQPSASATPPRIIAASAGVVSGTSPTSDGRIWVVAGNQKVKTLTEIRVSDGEVLNIAPLDNSATSVAASVNGPLAVGLGTPATGAVEFRSGGSGALLGTLPLAAPVEGIAVGDDGTTFYVLNGSHGNVANDNVTVVNSQTRQVQKTIPAPPASVAVQPTPDQSSVYVLTKFGQVNEISVATGRIESQFNVNMIGVGLAMAPSGQTLFVLGGPADARAIARIDLQTDSQDSAVPAAGSSVAIAPGVDDRQVYDFVGTARIGNVQIIQLPSA